MVRQLLLLSFVVGYALALTIRREHDYKPRIDYNEHHSMNVTSMMWDDGYANEEYTVKTNDGYLLTLIRVKSQTNNIVNSESWRNSMERSSEESRTSENREDKYQFNDAGRVSRRPPILLMPGLVSNSEDFIIGGPSQGLAYILADHGYDVFLANLRGSKYGSKHTTLDSTRDSAFWRFGIDEMSKKDVTAIIDKVLEITQHEKLTYIGHMEGTTVFYVMASEKPEYNDKIAAMISLGPVAFMRHSTNVLLKEISQHLDHPGWIIANLGQYRFGPRRAALMGSEEDCLNYENAAEMCLNPYFLLNGYNSKNINMTTLKRLIERTPEWVRTSTQHILNYAVFLRSRRFGKIVEEDDAASIKDYDLSKVTVPVSIFSTPEDAMSADEDVQKLVDRLPNVQKVIKMNQYTNNLDLLHGDNVKEEVFVKIGRILKNIMY